MKLQFVCSSWQKLVKLEDWELNHLKPGSLTCLSVLDGKTKRVGGSRIAGTPQASLCLCVFSHGFSNMAASV